MEAQVITSTRLHHCTAAVLVLLVTAIGSQAFADDQGLAPLRKKGYVRVCADADNLPFSSEENKTTPGFEIELARLIARDIGVDARFQWILTWVRPFWELKRGECDIFMGLPPTGRFKQSNPWIAVSRPYYTMSYAILARADAGITGPADLRGKRVAVDAGRPAEYWLLDRGLQRGLYKRQEHVFRGVETGEAPAGLLPLPLATWMARDKPALIVIPLPEPSLDVDLGAATRAEDAELTKAVDQAVGRLLTTGAVNEILHRYHAVR
jgi:ABC-type amino acid transport substrate-binding protein